MKFEVIQVNILIVEDEYSLADAIAKTLKKEKFNINIQSKELVARIKIILKRTNNIEDTSILEYGNLTLDIKNAKVKCNDSEIQISGKELDLLEQLLLRKAKAIYFRCFTRKLIKFG